MINRYLYTLVILCLSFEALIVIFLRKLILSKSISSHCIGSGIACLAIQFIPITWGNWPAVILSTIGKFLTSSAFAVVFLQVIYTACTVSALFEPWGSFFQDRLLTSDYHIKIAFQHEFLEIGILFKSGVQITRIRYIDN